MSVEGGDDAVIMPATRRYQEPGPHRYPRATSARVLAALFDVLNGLWLLSPGDILGGTPSYRLAHDHFIADTWLGLALLVFGLVMVASLVTDRWPRVVQAATWLSALTWVLFAVDLALVNTWQLGTLAYAQAAAIRGYAFVHLVLWQRQLDRDARQVGL